MQPFTSLDEDAIRTELATIVDAYLDANPAVVQEYAESQTDAKVSDSPAETSGEVPQATPAATEVQSELTTSNDDGEAVSLPIDQWLAEDEDEVDQVIADTTGKLFDGMNITAADLGVDNLSGRIQAAARDQGNESAVDSALVQAVGDKLTAGEMIPEDESKKLADSGIRFRLEYVEG
jgi:hypothetical protein